MIVKVKLYASLGRYAPEGKSGQAFTIDLPGDSTLETLVEKISLPVEETRILFVNGITQALNYSLKDGDEVGIFPPIGGG